MPVLEQSPGCLEENGMEARQQLGGRLEANSTVQVMMGLEQRLFRGGGREQFVKYLGNKHSKSLDDVEGAKSARPLTLQRAAVTSPLSLAPLTISDPSQGLLTSPTP